MAPVYYLNKTFPAPQKLHRKMLIEMDHSKLGKVTQIGVPVKLSETLGQVRTLGVPPRAKTDEILSHFGYAREEIKSRLSTGAVGLEPAATKLHKIDRCLTYSVHR